MAVVAQESGIRMLQNACAARSNKAWRRCVRSGHRNPLVAICGHRACQGSRSRPLLSNSGWNQCHGTNLVGGDAVPLGIQ